MVLGFSTNDDVILQTCQNLHYSWLINVWYIGIRAQLHSLDSYPELFVRSRFQHSLSAKIFQMLHKSREIKRETLTLNKNDDSIGVSSLISFDAADFIALISLSKLDIIKDSRLFKILDDWLGYEKIKLLKNRARGNRKTLQRPKMMSKINFGNLKLKSHEEYLICRTCFI